MAVPSRPNTAQAEYWDSTLSIILNAGNSAGGGVVYMSVVTASEIVELVVVIDVVVVVVEVDATASDATSAITVK